MKLPMKILAAVSSLVVLAGSMIPASASAATATFPQIVSENVSSSLDEAAAQAREYLKARSAEFTVKVDNIKFSSDKATATAEAEALSQSLIYKAFEETGNGNEGDYLRFAVKKYHCTIGTQNPCPLTYQVEYYTTPEEEAMLDDKVEQVLSTLTLEQKSDYEKIRAIYKYVTEKVSYSPSNEMKNQYIYSAYNAVIYGHAVCQGIAQLMYKMLNDSGIPCRIIAGISHDISGENPDGNHVWLIAKLEGKYYLLDPTWDLRYNGHYFLYFMKGSDDFDSVSPNITHIPRNDNGLSFPDYNSETFRNTYPISQYEYKPPTYSLGDLNGDKHIDAVDASMILAEYARISGNGSRVFNSEQNKFADLNGDNLIDSVDASLVLAYYSTVSNGKDIDISEFLNSH
ncbi:MAG: hypothetical protein K5898_16570 [Ruminococcus sp.]|uniref:transglutaminase domain-containing protein n=1 Tax=Ruminococcus sp. TaxID=41978 RepID=UPI0025D451AB|nr:transglutaminase domain-containing protein [Ruminococcus sp.]MCR4796755.1 hypothetical protein [Ruminococcus sp.]